MKLFFFFHFSHLFNTNFILIDLFQSRADQFPSFFYRVLSILSTSSTDIWIRTQLTHFLTISVSNLDLDFIRKEISPLVSILIWSRLSSESLRDGLIAQAPTLKKLWKHFQKRLINTKKSGDQEEYTKLVFSSEWLFSAIMGFLGMLYDVDDSLISSQLSVSFELQYITRFLELLISLVSQLPTRRFTNDLLLDTHLIPVIKQSPLFKSFCLMTTYFLSWLIC